MIGGVELITFCITCLLGSIESRHLHMQLPNPTEPSSQVIKNAINSTPPINSWHFYCILDKKCFFCVFLRSDQFLHTSTYVYFIYPRLIHLDILSYLNFLNEYASFSTHFRLDKVFAIAMSQHNHFTWKFFKFQKAINTEIY